MAHSKEGGVDHPPGTFGILSGDLARWSWFTQALIASQFPAGSQVVYCSGQWIAGALNEIIGQMQPQSEWLVVLADDHTWPSDLFPRLLDHHLDIVAPLVNLRRYPFAPSLFHDHGNGNYQGYSWAELAGKTGLLAVDTYGGPCAVIRRRVLDALGPPWFQCEPGQPVYPHEDLYFFSRARQAGFQPYVDLDQVIGHCLPALTTPQRLSDGTYGVRLSSYEDLGLFLPGEQTGEVSRYHAYT